MFINGSQYFGGVASETREFSIGRFTVQPKSGQGTERTAFYPMTMWTTTGLKLAALAYSGMALAGGGWPERPRGRTSKLLVRISFR